MGVLRDGGTAFSLGDSGVCAPEVADSWTMTPRVCGVALPKEVAVILIVEMLIATRRGGVFVAGHNGICFVFAVLALARLAAMFGTRRFGGSVLMYLLLAGVLVMPVFFVRLFFMRICRS